MGRGSWSRHGVRERIRPLPRCRTRSALSQNLPKEQGSCTGRMPAPLAPSWNILPLAAGFSTFQIGAQRRLFSD